MPANLQVTGSRNAYIPFEGAAFPRAHCGKRLSELCCPPLPHPNRRSRRGQSSVSPRGIEADENNEFSPLCLEDRECDGLNTISAMSFPAFCNRCKRSNQGFYRFLWKPADNARTEALSQPHGQLPPDSRSHLKFWVHWRKIRNCFALH